MKTSQVFKLMITLVPLAFGFEARAGLLDNFFGRHGVPSDSLGGQQAVPLNVDGKTYCFSTDANGNFYRAKTVGSNCTLGVKSATPIKKPTEAIQIKSDSGQMVAKDSYVEISRHNGIKYYAKKEGNDISVVAVKVTQESQSDITASRQVVGIPFSTVALAAVTPATQTGPSAANDSATSEPVAAASVDGEVQTPAARPTDANNLTVDGTPAEATNATQPTNLPAKPAYKPAGVSGLGSGGGSGTNRNHSSRRGKNANQVSSGDGNGSVASGLFSAGGGDGGSCALVKDFPANSQAYCGKITTAKCGTAILKTACANVPNSDSCKPVGCAKAFEKINNDPNVQAAKDAFFKAQKAFAAALIAARDAAAKTDTNEYCVKLPSSEYDADEFIKNGWHVDKYVTDYNHCEQIENQSWHNSNKPSPLNPTGGDGTH